MYNLPQPPNTLITHQLDCVRCKHIFPVAEDTPIRRRRMSGQWTALVQWHPDEHRHTLYDHPEDYPPGPHADPYLIEREPGHESHYLSDKNMPIFCPRCGADNRNWLYLTRNKHSSNLQSASNYIIAASLIFLVVTVLIYIFVDFPSSRKMRTLVFWVCITLSWILPLLIVSGQWQAVREYRYFKDVAGNLSFRSRISPAWKTALSLLVVFVFVIPIVLILIVPVLVGFSETTFVVNEQTDTIKQIDLLTRKLPTYLEENPQDIRTVVNSLKVIQTQLGIQTNLIVPPEPEQVPAQTREWALSVLDGARNQVTSLNTNELDALRRNLEPAYNLVQGIEGTETAENVNFVFTWFKFVGLVSLVSSIFAVLAAEHLEREYDKHLPRPIYHSLSDMTRVAKWEVNKALSTHESVTWVQWTNVERNQMGGLILTGYLRDRPTSSNSETVRAQKYTVVTDRWCYIVNAEIADMQTPPPPVGNSSEWVRSVQRIGRDTPQGGGTPSVSGGNGRRQGNGNNTPQLPSSNNTSNIYIPLP